MKHYFRFSGLAALTIAIASFATEAAPLNTSYGFKDLESKSQLLHNVYIISKNGKYINPRDVAELRKSDGRWNLSQSESKLGVKVTDEQTGQLMACIGEIICPTLVSKNEATAVSVLRPDMLVTARHVFFAKDGKNEVSINKCTFHNYLNQKAKIPVVVYHNNAGFYFNNFDYVVVRLKTKLAGCNSFGIDKAGSLLELGNQFFSVTTNQKGMLNPISSKEPVVARGEIKQVFEGAFDGPSMYWTDVDLGGGGSGGAIFALDRQGNLVVGEDGRLAMKAMATASGTGAKNGQPYKGELRRGNQSILIGLDSTFMKVILKMGDELEAMAAEGTRDNSKPGWAS